MIIVTDTMSSDIDEDTGYNVKTIFANSNPFGALLWASTLGAITAGSLLIVQRVLSVSEVMDAWVAGAKSMITALMILIHAWALSRHVVIQPIIT